MKTISKMILAFTLTLFFFGQTIAQSTGQDQNVQNEKSAVVKTTASPGTFVDANKDGICDNYQMKQSTGKGPNFVDKNGDGICDNRPAGTNCKGTQCCQGKGRGFGQGNCCGRGHCGAKGQGQGFKHRNGMGNQPVVAPTSPEKK